MRTNYKLRKAKSGKNDEFYTQMHDIEAEIKTYLDHNPDVFRGKTVLLPCDDSEYSNFTRYFAQHFDEFGLKRLISTSYAPESKNYIGQFSFVDTKTDRFNIDKFKRCGKLIILDKDNNQDGKIDIQDIEWSYLEGTGDFASKEVTRLRDKADIIITNPPFSKFREFLKWIMDAPDTKQFAIIGNVNAITSREVFPLITQNRMWVGASAFNIGMYFCVPDEYEHSESYMFDRIQNDRKVMHIPSICWYTNIEHNKRHKPMSLLNMTECISRRPKLKKQPYSKYDNYDAIEVPAVNAIPSDYDGEMGVPITFLDKYCPEQFEIVGFFNGSTLENKAKDGYVLSKDTPYINKGKKKIWNGPTINEKAKYFRIVIKHKRHKTK